MLTVAIIVYLLLVLVIVVVDLVVVLVVGVVVVLQVVYNLVVYVLCAVFEASFNLDGINEKLDIRLIEIINNFLFSQINSYLKCSPSFKKPLTFPFY